MGIGFTCSIKLTDGGSSTDVGNPATISGRILNKDGTDAAHTEVYLLPGSFNPVLDSIIPDSLIDTTDLSGKYTFNIADSGLYNIQAVHLTQRTRLLTTDIIVQYDTTIVPAARLKDPGIIKVFLSDTVDTVNGYIYIEGTTLFKHLTESSVDSNGISVTIDSAFATTIPSIFLNNINNPTISIRISDPIEVISNSITIIDPLVSWIHYTTANSGLPEDRIDEVYVCFNGFSWMQDSISFWFTTNSSGIVVFNKNTWKTYDKNSSSIPSDLITQVLRYDNEDVVWVSSVHGFFKFDGSDWQVWDTQNGLPDNLMCCMALCSNGDIWGGMYPGVGFFDKGSEQWTIYDTVATGLETHYIEDVAVDKNDNPWYMTSKGAAYFNGSSWQVYTQASGLLSDSTHCVVVDSMDNVWIGHEDGGLSRYDGNQWTTFTSADSKILGSIIRDIVPDENNNIWIGSGTGLTMFDGTKWKDYDGDRYSIVENKSIRSIFIDNEGTVWLGTNSSGVIGFSRE